MEPDKTPQPVIIVTDATEIQELKLSDESIVYLQQSGKWARFLGVTGIVTAVLLFLFGIFFVSELMEYIYGEARTIKFFLKRIILSVPWFCKI